VSREQQVRVGDLVLSRHNDAGLTVRPGIGHRRGDRIDQVRNGNRWRVIGVDTQRGCIVAERLTDSARVIFEGDYLREHIVLGYAGTVHSAQGMTIGNSNQHGVCWTIVSDRASRAMAYVGMTGARDENHLAIDPAVTNEAHQHTHGCDTVIHQTRVAPNTLPPNTSPRRAAARHRGGLSRP
jgi:ATP-dependent exoDNAse (exonuclease V) alpha subunit